MADVKEPIVSLADDADLATPAQMAARLVELTRDGSVEADYYGNGGAVAALEADFAQLLGKERAVMFPTGTLANLMAMRLLAGTDGGRVLVHRHSHFFNDSGENLSLLGGFTMVPLGGADAGFSADDVEGEIKRAASARVASRIGAIAIESPSRMLDNRRFGTERIAEIAALAGEAGVPMFLDGARMLIECVYSGQSAAAMSAPFDLVYVSLYKYLGAPFGCVLAGPAAMLDGLYHDRRRFGGSLYQMWPAAVLARAALARHDATWEKAKQAGRATLAHLEKLGAFPVLRFADGTNVVRIDLGDQMPDADALKAAGLAHGLKLGAPAGSQLPVKINESWAKLPPDDLAQRIVAALRSVG